MIEVVERKKIVDESVLEHIVPKKEKKIKKLGKRNYELIREGVKMEGTYDPDIIFPAFEERLYCDEVQTIYDFLKWVHDNGKCFGSGNYELVFKLFIQNG